MLNIKESFIESFLICKSLATHPTTITLSLTERLSKEFKWVVSVLVLLIKTFDYTPLHLIFTC